MSTRSQKRKTNHQNGTENVSENLVSPVLVGGMDPSEPDVMVAGPSKAKSPSVENSILDLRISFEEEFTSEIKRLLFESRENFWRC